MPVLVTCKFEKDLIKNNREKVETSFSPLKVNGSFLLMESAPKLKSSLSPIPLMIHIKFDQDWPTGLRDSIISLLKI